MCFSTSASFVSSAGLLLLGGASYATAKKKDKVLVAIPLMFGLQQAFEGMQWLYLDHGSRSLPAAYGFLFFALIVWPAYVPSFVYMLDKKHRKILRWFMVMGAAVALYFVGILLTQHVRVHVYQGSIRYSFHFPNEYPVLAGYLIAIFGSLFVSSRPIFRWFGLGISVLSFIAWRIYMMDFLSVWCFFAAVVSSMFFVYIQYDRSVRNRKSAGDRHAAISKA